MRILIILVFLFITFGQVWAADKGIFVWSLENVPVLCSEKEMDNLVNFAQKHEIKTLFVQVYQSNKAWFPSKVGDSSPYQECLQKVSSDPLALLIKKAHLKGLEVHAWMNMLSLGNNKNAKMLRTYGPGILTRNVQPKHVLEDYKIDNQFFLEPSDPNVRQESVDVVKEILQRYPELDGIQFDYIRYPDVHPFYGYSKNNLERFKKITGKKVIKENDPVWKQWKRDQVTELLKRLVSKVRSIHPKIHISTTGCLSFSRAYEEAFQDWPSWINKGLVEFVTVMDYPPDVPTFKKNVIDIKSKVEDFSKVNVAVGAYKPEQKLEDFTGQFKFCENSGAKSCVLFHYNEFVKKPAFSQVLEKK